MCHITRNINSMNIITTVQNNRGNPSSIRVTSSTSNNNVGGGGGGGREQSKMTFRLSPFRKVAKSARINLNRYWGILSQSSAMKPAVPKCPVQSLVVGVDDDHSEEIEQNRINEILEAQAQAAAAAVDDNDRNTEYENSPDFHSSNERRFFFSSSSTSCVSMASSVSDFIIPFHDQDFMMEDDI